MKDEKWNRSVDIGYVKNMANVIRASMCGEHYYDRYKDLSVADLLLVLEDENYHSCETIVEALVSLDYGLIQSAIAIAYEHYEAGCLTPELSERRAKLDKLLRK